MIVAIELRLQVGGVVQLWAATHVLHVVNNPGMGIDAAYLSCRHASLPTYRHIQITSSIAMRSSTAQQTPSAAVKIRLVIISKFRLNPTLRVQS
jgi:hypothetical protein